MEEETATTEHKKIEVFIALLEYHYQQMLQDLSDHTHTRKNWNRTKDVLLTLSAQQMSKD